MRATATLRPHSPDQRGNFRNHPDRPIDHTVAMSSQRLHVCVHECHRRFMPPMAVPTPSSTIINHTRACACNTAPR